MAAMDFPATPTVGQLYPDPPTMGVPQYRWDGGAWLAVSTPEDLSYVRRTGDAMSGQLTLSGAPVDLLHATTKQYVDGGVDGLTGGLNSKAGLDALAYSGMQINGAMEINQQGVVAVTGAAGYPCDGWAWAKNASASALTAERSNIVGPIPGFDNYITVGINTAAAAAAGDYAFLAQSIEGYRTVRLEWGTANARPITIAFWSCHQVSGVFGVTVQNASVNRSYTTTYTHVPAGAAQYNVITIPGDITGTWGKTNGAGIIVAFPVSLGSTYVAPAANTWAAGNYLAAPGLLNVAASTGNTFRVGGVIVLPGIYAPTATQSPLLMRPYDQELVTCKRYWEQIYVYNYEWAAVAGAAQVGLLFPFSVEKRAVPTLAYGAGGLGNCSFNANTLTTKDLNVALNVTAVGHYSISHQATLDARL